MGRVSRTFVNTWSSTSRSSTSGSSRPSTGPLPHVSHGTPTLPLTSFRRISSTVTTTRNFLRSVYRTGLPTHLSPPSRTSVRDGTTQDLRSHTTTDPVLSPSKCWRIATHYPTPVAVTVYSKWTRPRRFPVPPDLPRRLVVSLPSAPGSLSGTPPGSASTDPIHPSESTGVLRLDVPWSPTPTRDDL